MRKSKGIDTMTETTSEIIVRPEPQHQIARSVLDMPPQQMVNQVSAMANILSDIIEKQKMFQPFNGKKYVTVDGWCTLGTMLGILPAERDVHETDKGWYAKVDLVNKNSGVVVGSASAICTRDERSWKDRPDYAVRSMSITRATGKAYRLAFSWIMNMAGYQSTPAEEMPIEEATTIPRSEPTPKEKAKILFDVNNQKHLDKLEKVLNERNIEPSKHVLAATILHGLEFSKENVDMTITKLETN